MNVYIFCIYLIKQLQNFVQFENNRLSLVLELKWVGSFSLKEIMVDFKIHLESYNNCIHIFLIVEVAFSINKMVCVHSHYQLYRWLAVCKMVCVII